MPSFTAAVVQMAVTRDKEQNLQSVAAYLRQAQAAQADLVVLPEMFICPYDLSLFPEFGEPEGGAVWTRLSELARQHQVYLVAGSMPESDARGLLYNTSFVFDRQGRQIAKHRKMHLVEMQFAGKEPFREADTLAPGNEITVFPTEFGPLGLCICFDIRFPEIFRIMVDQGAVAVICPAAFNRKTGSAHWEILCRLRAVDNQVFLLASSPAQDFGHKYVTWGHSLVVDPWGKILGELDEKHGFLVTEINTALVDKVRRELPLLQCRRHELYEVVDKT